jgi:hypothetical protein
LGPDIGPIIAPLEFREEIPEEIHRRFLVPLQVKQHLHPGLGGGSFHVSVERRWSCDLRDPDAPGNPAGEMQLADLCQVARIVAPCEDVPCGGEKVPYVFRITIDMDFRAADGDFYRRRMGSLPQGDGFKPGHAGGRSREDDDIVMNDRRLVKICGFHRFGFLMDWVEDLFCQRALPEPCSSYASLSAAGVNHTAPLKTMIRSKPMMEWMDCPPSKPMFASGLTHQTADV